MTARLADVARNVGERLAVVTERYGVTQVDRELTTAAGLTVSRSAMVRGQREALLDAREEVWVVLRGRLRVATVGRVREAGAGEVLHVPENTPGYLEAVDDTELVRVGS